MATKNFDSEDTAVLFLEKIFAKQNKASQTGTARQGHFPQQKQVQAAPSPNISSPSARRKEPQDYVDPNEYYGHRPLSEKIIRKHENTKERYKSIYNSKDEVFQDALTELCDRYKMHIKFKGGVAFVTTIAGEWQFRYNDRPIQLFHSNSKKGKGDLHNQRIRFYSPLDVIRYIYFHEGDREKRLMTDPEEKD